MSGAYDPWHMRAELKSLESADAVEGLERFRPADGTNFTLSIGAIVGPAGGEGGDLFYFHVTTATWLEQNPPPKGFEFLRRLLVTHWDYELVRRAVSDLVAHTQGEDWNELATKLSRYGHWEFEDYREGS
jgi:hypothetical protein